jgi:putative membrane protein
MNAALYPYVKVLHLLFVIAWMAGIFYLPRILVHYVEGRNAGEDVRRLKVMGRKLYHFASAMAVLAIIFGLMLWVGFHINGGWLHAKLTLVLLLVVYHIMTRVMVKRMQRDEALPRAITLRIYNEAPVLLLLGILYLVIVKPF